MATKPPTSHIPLVPGRYQDTLLTNPLISEWYEDFQKWGTPQIVHVNKIFRNKPSSLGYSHLCPCRNPSQSNVIHWYRLHVSHSSSFNTTLTSCLSSLRPEIKVLIMFSFCHVGFHSISFFHVDRGFHFSLFDFSIRLVCGFHFSIQTYMFFS